MCLKAGTCPYSQLRKSCAEPIPGPERGPVATGGMFARRRPRPNVPPHRDVPLIMFVDPDVKVKSDEYATRGQPNNFFRISFFGLATTLTPASPERRSNCAGCATLRGTSAFHSAIDHVHFNAASPAPHTAPFAGFAWRRPPRHNSRIRTEAAAVQRPPPPGGPSRPTPRHQRVRSSHLPRVPERSNLGHNPDIVSSFAVSSKK